MNKNNVIFFFLFFFCATIISCTHTPTSKKNRALHPSHNCADSAIYHGLFPCASCLGIDTWFAVFKNKNGLQFKMTEKYIEERDGFFISTGRVTLSEDKTLLQIQKEGETLYFRVKENSLLLLGNDPKKEENEAYRLYKMPDCTEK